MIRFTIAYLATGFLYLFNDLRKPFDNRPSYTGNPIACLQVVVIWAPFLVLMSLGGPTDEMVLQVTGHSPRRRLLFFVIVFMGVFYLIKFIN